MSTIGNVKFRCFSTTYALIVLLLCLFSISPVYAVSGVAQINKGFTPNPMNPGEVSTLKFSIFNSACSGALCTGSNYIPLTNAGFTDTFPAGMTIDSSSVITNTCPTGTPVITATPGTNQVVVTGLTVPAFSGSPGQCDITVQVTSVVQGNSTNPLPIGVLQTAEGISNTSAGSNALTVNPLPSPTAIFSLSNTTIYLGQTTNLTIAITDNGGISLTNTAWSNTLPAGLEISGAPTTVTGCGGGVFTAPIGGTAMSLSNATIAGLATCTIIVPIKGTIQGNYKHTAGAGGIFMPAGSVTSKQGVTNSDAFVDIAVQSFGAAKSFLTTPVKTNQISTMKIVITSPASYSSLAFTDDFALQGLTGLQVASPPNASITSLPAGNCSGTFAPVAGATSVSLSAGSMTGNGNFVTPTTCTISVDVVVPLNANTGSKTNTIAAGSITGSAGSSNVNDAIATLVVNPYVAPTITKAFATDPIFVGQSSSMTVSVKNNDTVSFTNLGWTDTLPAGLVVNGAASKNAVCSGGSVLPAAGGGTAVSLSGVTIAAGQTCIVTVPVTTTQQSGVAPNPGPYVNTIPIGNITNNQGTTNTALTTATLNTSNTLAVSKAFGAASVAVGVPTTLTITISNASTHGYNALAFTDSFIAGGNNLPNLRIATPLVASTTCGTGTVNAVANGQSVGLTGGQIIGGTLGGAAATCTVTVNVVATAGFASTANTIPIGGVTGTDASNGTAASSYQAATANIAASVVTAPTLTKTFSASPVYVGQAFNAVIAVKNNDGAFALTNVNWSDNLPVGLKVNGVATKSAGCTGTSTVTAPLNGTAIGFSAGTIATGTTCTVTVPVVATLENQAPGFTNSMPADAVQSTQTTTSNASSATVITRTINGIKAFSQPTVHPNTPVTLTITIQNYSTDSYNNLGFTDLLSNVNANLKVAPTPNASTTCNASTVPTLTAGANSSSVVLANGSIGAGSSGTPSTCTVTVDVQSAVAFASAANTIAAGAITANAVSDGSAAKSYADATANLAVIAIVNPTLAKSFSPNPVYVGQTSTLSISVTNNDPLIPLTNVQWADSLPANLTMTTAPVANANCGAPSLTTAGQTINFGATTGGTIAAGTTCTVTVDVVADRQSLGTNFLNSMAAATSNEANSNTATATLTVNTLKIVKTFDGAGNAAFPPSPAVSNINTVVKLRLTLYNYSTSAYNNIAFSDTFGAAAGNPPATFVIATPNNLVTTCTGAVTATQNTRTISMTGGTLAAGSAGAPTSCYIEVDTTGSVAFTNKANTIPATNTSCVGAGALTATDNNGGAAQGSAACDKAGTTANLTLGTFANPTLGKSFSTSPIFVGQNTNLTITVRNNDNAGPLTNVAWTDDLMRISGAGIVVNGVATVSPSCGAGTVDTSTPPLIKFTGGTIAALATCTVTIPVTGDRTGVFVNRMGDAVAYRISDAQGVTDATILSPTLTVRALSVAKAFTTTPINAGATNTLTITISNNATNAYSSLNITDDLTTMGAGGDVKIAPTPNASTTCNSGSEILTANPNAQIITLTGGAIGAGNSTTATTCIIKVDVVGYISGAKTNTITPANVSATAPNLTTTTIPANITGAFTVTAAARPTIAKTFSKTPIKDNGVDSSLLRITVTNSNSIGVNNVDITDTFPAALNGLVIASSPAAVNTCNGTFTATAGSNSLHLSGGTVAAASTCYVEVPVVSTLPFASSPNTASINSASTTAGQVIAGFPRTSAVNIQATDVLTATKQFGSTLPMNANTGIALGTKIRLTVVITNDSAVVKTGLAFSDTFPVTGTGRINVATPANISNTCGGSITNLTTSFSLSGGIIPAYSGGVAGSCTVSLDVVGVASGALQNNRITNIVSTQTPTAILTNIAPITVSAATTAYTVNSKVYNLASPIPLTQSSPNLRATITWTQAAAPIISTTNPSVTDNLPTGLRVADTPNATTTCGTINATTVNSNSASRDQIVIALNHTQTASQACSVSFDITPTAPGVTTNKIYVGDIVSTNGASNTNSVTAAMTVNNVLTIGKSFQPNHLNSTGVSLLTITITNPETLALTGASITDTLPNLAAPDNLIIATPSDATSNCTATGTGNPALVTADPGTRTITLNGGIIPAKQGAVDGVCTISVKVKSGNYAAGVATNNIAASTLTTAEGRTNSNPTSATITFQSTEVGVSKQFNPLSVAGGSVSRLTITIGNTANNYDQTGISFTDNMPAGMTIGVPPIPAEPIPAPAIPLCTGGTISGATPGASTWSYSGGTVLANGSCRVEVNATMTTVATLINPIPIGTVTTSNGSTNIAPASASLTNNAGASFSKSFSPNPLLVNVPTKLTITVTNSSPLNFTNLHFDDDLTLGNTQTGLTVASTPNSFTDCPGGTVSFNPARTLVSLTGASLATGSSCTVTIDLVTSTAGTYTNKLVPGTLHNNENITNTTPAEEILTVNASIKAVKKLDLDTDSGKFNLTMSPAAPTGATSRLSVGHDKDIDIPSITPFAALAGTAYTITETGAGGTVVSNYTSTWVCLNADLETVSSGTGAVATVTPPASGGAVTPNKQAITCTFTNVNKKPYLTLYKTTVGGTGSFNFTGNNGIPSSTITTATAGVTATALALTNAPLTATGIATTITEAVAPDFALSGASCTGLKLGDTASLVGNVITIPATSIIDGARLACTFTNTKTSVDHGDAPGLSLGYNYGDAAHGVPTTPLVYLGLMPPDADTSADVTAWQGQNAANGDNSTGAADEDLANSNQLLDTGSFVFAANSGNTYTLILNCTGAGSFVSGWIDFNRNKIFDGTEAQGSTCSGGKVTLSWTLPADIQVGGSYARFRIATAMAEVSNPTSVTAATDGEVEDYPISIIKNPTVSVRKTTVGGFGGPFSFAQTNLVSVPAGITTTAANVATPAVLTPIKVSSFVTPVTLTETLISGYTLTSAVCSDANSGVTGNPASFGSLVGNVLTIPAVNLLDAADIICDFTNTLSTTVKVQKITQGDFGGPFSFTQTNLASAPADISTTVVNTATPALPTGINVTTLLSDVTLTETVAAGYNATSGSCNDANSAVTGNINPVGSLVGNVMTISGANVKVGADITCTFTNSKIPTVKVKKITLGDVGGPFSFTQTNLASAPAAITTTAENTATPASPTAINVTTTGADVTLTETLATGYTTTSASCTDANSGVTGNPASFGSLLGNQLTILGANVKVGADITCTFTNSKIPTVKVQKRTLGGFNGPFSFAQTNLASAPADITTTVANTLTPLAPTAISVSSIGSPVTLTETSTAGYTLSSASCSDANNAVTGNPASFGSLVGNALTIAAGNVKAGADITCIFTNSNTAASTVKVQKTTLGGIGGPFSFTQTNLATDPVDITTTLVNSATPAAPAAINVTSIGTAVTITETVATGYTLTSASCSDANSGVTGNPVSFGTLVGNVLTIAASNVAGGADISCNFTNSKIPTVKVQKTTQNGVGGLFSFSNTNLTTPITDITTLLVNTATPAAPTAHNVTNIASPVTLTETLATGYSLTSAVCNDANFVVTGNTNPVGSLAGNILTLSGTEIRAGADINCNFTNTYTPADYDHGDAPDGTISSVIYAYGDASHATPSASVFLGSVPPDTDTAGNVTTWQGQTTAAGDDSNGTADEGIIQLLTSSLSNFPTLATADTSYSLTLRCAGTATVSGWIDFNKNNTFDAGERQQASCTSGSATLTWSGLSGLTVGNTYARFRIASSAIDVANPTGIAADGEVEDYLLSIVGSSTAVTGTVFKDTGTGGGTANDGIQNGGELGLNSVVVKLTNCGTTTYSTATTNASGVYSLSTTGVSAGASVCVEETNPSAYISTGVNVSGAGGGGVYTFTHADKISFTLPANKTASGLNFGDVPPNEFLTDGINSGLPGSTIIYPHIFIAQTAGSVTFNLSGAIASPNVSGWSEVLYIDTNQNGLLDGIEGTTAVSPTTAYALLEGEKKYLIQKEFIPAGISNGASNIAPVQAVFVYTNATSITPTVPVQVANATLKRQDVTTVGTGVLFLHKEVRNVTQSGSLVTNNTAKPGDELEYKITYTNNGSTPITELIINDTTPPYTTFLTAVGDCDPSVAANPTSLGTCNLTHPSSGSMGALKWTFTSPPTPPTLHPSASGSVLFRVRVNQ